MKRSLASTALLLFAFGCGVDSHVDSVYLDQDGNTYYTPPTPIFRDVTFTLASNHLSRSEGVTRSLSTSEDPGVDSLVISVNQFSLEGEEEIDLIAPEAGIVSFDLSSTGQDVASVTLDPGDSPEGATVHISAIALSGTLDHDGSTFFYDIDMNGAIDIHADLSGEDLSLDSEVTIVLPMSEAVTAMTPVLEQAIVDGGIQPGTVIRIDTEENVELGSVVTEVVANKLKEDVRVEVVFLEDDAVEKDAGNDGAEAGEDRVTTSEQSKGEERDKTKETTEEVEEEEDEDEDEDEEEDEEKQEVKEEKKEVKQEVKEEKKEEKQEAKEEKKEEKKEDKKDNKKDKGKE